MAKAKKKKKVLYTKIQITVAIEYEASTRTRGNGMDDGFMDMVDDALETEAEKVANYARKVIAPPEGMIVGAVEFHLE